MISGAQYVTQNSFPSYDTYNPTPGKEHKYHGHPNKGQRPFADDNPHYYHGVGKVNPYMYSRTWPDGHRESYNYYSSVKEHSYVSGGHKIWHRDGVVDTQPGRRHEFTGGGGRSHATTGSIDETGKTHDRGNTLADTYDNKQGGEHTYVGGPSVTHYAGNVHIEAANKMRTRLVNDKASWSVSAGPNDPHDANMTMTKDRLYFRNTTKGDLWLDTNANTINHQAGTDHNTHAKQNISLKADGDHYVLKAGKIYLDGDVFVTGNVKIAKEMNSKSANVATHWIAHLLVGDVSEGQGSAPSVNAPAAKSLSHGTIS